MRFQDWPSLRLVIPLIAGIIISDTIDDTHTVITVSAALLCSALVVVILSFIYNDRLAVLYGAGLSLCFACIGSMLYALHSRQVMVEWKPGPATHKGMLIEYPYERARSYRLDLVLEDSPYTDIKIYLYVPKDSLSAALVPGEHIVFNGTVNKPSNDGTPDLDYAAYLYRHGISGTLWVPADRWRRTASALNLPFRAKAARTRRIMYDKYKEWGLKGNVLAVVAAVSLGIKRELDQGLKQMYSTSGASHVLAVAGLHVGIMCAFLYFMMPAFLFKRRWIRDVIVMTVMWGYAVMIGLPLSITRSLIMFSMLALCKVLHRDSSGINTLSLAALVILMCNPAALFDLGFQLSFLAVLFILLLEPEFSALVKPRTAVGTYIRDLISVSIAAQIGTAPVIMYNFANFSTYFLVTNLVIVPLMFLTVCMSMTLWVVGWIEPLRWVTVKCLSGLVGIQNACLEKIVGLPHSRMDISIDNPLTVWTIYAVILLVFLWIKERRTHRLVQALACIAVQCIAVTIQSFVV